MKILVLTFVFLASLTACGSNKPAATPDAPAQATAPAHASNGSEEDDVPGELKFTAKTLDGRRFDGTTLAGKDAVLWFWAPWCTECRREAPHVAKAQAANPDVAFVGVAGLGEVKAMREFVRDYKVGAFDHLADLDGTLWKRFGVVQQPAYAFVDETGSIEVHRGELGASGIADRLADLTNN